ncbi:unnamed protein product [Bursaphelenchus okinawaensis]|uniref:Uncharacterized protein n=1 Tax=Bursaphelenchus okinawaensis TaxID=465554 RepID=A0A811LDT8_9BILA|nr:unnamed protein product [Bursaphelenchus okinawaensis]CAG9121192.1 unnamed protein product [Bursaphelenchus okinawaensis]
MVVTRRSQKKVASPAKKLATPTKVDIVEKKKPKKVEKVKKVLKKRKGLILTREKQEVDHKKYKAVNGYYVLRKYDSEKAKKEILSQAGVALEAMAKHTKKNSKTDLFGESKDSIAIKFHLKKPRVTGVRRFKIIQLPHSDREPGNSTLCLILGDQNAKQLRDKKNWDTDVDKNARKWKDTLREKHGITSDEVDKIYTYTQFLREYSTKESVKAFLKSYDRVVIQNNLFKVLVRHFGASCWNVSKFPLPINPRSERLKEKLLKTYSQEALVLPVHVQVHSVRIGNIHQPQKHLVANIKEVLEAATKCLPGGFLNVRTASLCFLSNAQELPIYVDFGSANELIEKVVKKVDEVIEDECTTLPEGLKVKMHMDGKVDVVDEESGEAVFYPTVEDEWEKHDDPDLKPRATRESLIRREVFKRKSAEKKKAAKKAKLEAKKEE